MHLDATHLRRADREARLGRAPRATPCSLNRIYQELSNAVAGSQEYMRMEKLYELYAGGALTTCWGSDRRPRSTRLTAWMRRSGCRAFVDSRSLHLFIGRESSGPEDVGPRHRAVPVLGGSSRDRRGPPRTCSEFSCQLRRHGQGFRDGPEHERASGRRAHHLPARHLTPPAASTRRSSSTAGCASAAAVAARF